MLKATEDFTRAGVTVVAGQEVEPLTFEADEVELLLRAGLLVKLVHGGTSKADKPAKGQGET